MSITHLQPPAIDTAKLFKVAVLFGGASAERKITL